MRFDEADCLIYHNIINCAYVKTQLNRKNIHYLIYLINTSLQETRIGIIIKSSHNNHYYYNNKIIKTI